MLMLVNTKAKSTTVVKQTPYVGIYFNLFHRKATSRLCFFLDSLRWPREIYCFAVQCFWCCTRTQTHVRRPPDQNITINWGSKWFTSNALKWATWKFERRMEAFPLFPFGFLLHRLTYTTASYIVICDRNWNEYGLLISTKYAKYHWNLYRLLQFYLSHEGITLCCLNK